MICSLCPRKCGAVRTEEYGEGYCRSGALPVVARVAPHFGEEPCISGSKGSGTVFFSGCTLGCVFCQNYEISAENKGRIITPGELADCYKRLEEQGAHNINLVTADHFAPAVVESLEIYKPRVPVVYNCGGYVSPAVLSMLDGYIDVYLPDFKYSDDSLAIKYSSAPGYTDIALAAIREMIFQVGEPELDDNGLIKSGVIVRHLILPSHTRNSIEVIDILRRNFSGQILVSLMCQYVPCGRAAEFPKIKRTLTKREYDKVKRELMLSGLDGFTQDLSSATKDWIPKWDF
ncbi:MAG: radical SAM protein [Ruminococcus sp.]|nr:radical SAM protein [Ruminococcus sp.]